MFLITFFAFFLSSEGPYAPAPLPIDVNVTIDYSSKANCLPNQGKDYKGTLSVTMRGFTCLPWASPKAVKKAVGKEFLPEVKLEANYCRNPDDDTEGPWCFVDYPNVTMDYCELELCGKKMPRRIQMFVSVLSSLRL